MVTTPSNAENGEVLSGLSPSKSEQAAAAIAGALPGPVLIVGSLPPQARDLDLLVPLERQGAVESALVAAGFQVLGQEWVGVPGTNLAGQRIEVLPPSRWGLTPARVAELFQQSEPLSGLPHLLRPPPHVTLLLLASQLGLDGRLDTRRRERISGALAADPAAWQKASAMEATWTVRWSLAWLEQAHRRGDHGTGLARWRAAWERLRAQQPSPSWTALRAVPRLVSPAREPVRVVALSGLDGAGKSTQARLLAEALASAGFEAVTMWKRISYNDSLLWVTAPVRALLQLMPRTRRRLADQATREMASEDPAGTTRPPESHLALRGIRQRWPALSPVWITVVALLHAVPLRRSTLRELRLGRVVIRDRYLLDSQVHIQDHFRSSRVGFQMWLLTKLAPPPLVAFYLDVPAEEAYRRKPEEHSIATLQAHRKLYLQGAPRLGVHVLDATAPASELARIIASEVLTLLTREGPRVGH